jgi:NADH:ubiquinone oxidoreductase subunit E
MLVYEKNALSVEIESLIEEYGSSRSSLLQILQEIQRRYKHVSAFAQQEVARLMNIHPVEVHSFITFYSFLDTFPQGKNIVRLCKSITCDMHGKDKIENAIKRELNIEYGETTQDKRITLEHTNCLGMCDVGPAMLINEKVYTSLDPEKAVQILNDLK